MSSFENLFGSFMGLPESDKRKFVEIFQKLSCVKDSSANNVDQLDLPSGSHVFPETPSSLPELFENETKKSPMKQNTLDKWLLKSKVTTSKEGDETSKTLQDGNENSSNQLKDLVNTNDSITTSNKLVDVIEIANASEENSLKRDYSYQDKQLMFNKFPVVLLQKIHLDDVVLESCSTEDDNISEGSNSSFSVQNPHVMEKTTADPISSDDINNLPMEDNNNYRQFGEQASTLKDLPHVSEYSSKLRVRTRKPKNPSTESIHLHNKCSKVNKNNNMHLERNKTSPLSKKPAKETKSLITLEKSQLDKNKNLKESSLPRDHWDDVIESVVKNVNSVPKSDSKKQVIQKILKGCPKMKIQKKISKSAARNLADRKIEKNEISHSSNDFSQGLEQVPQSQRNSIDKVEINNGINEKLTSYSHSEFELSSKLKESNTKVCISRLKEKLTISSAMTENVVDNMSLNDKKDVNDPLRRTKRTLFLKDSSNELILDQEPSYFSKKFESIPILISNSGTDMPEVLSSVTECSKKPCLKKKAILKTKTSVFRPKRKRSLDKKDISNSEKLEKCVKFCSLPDQDSSDIKAPNVAGCETPKIKRNILCEKSKSSHRKTTPKKCIKSESEVECHKISDNLLIETHEMKDFSNNSKLNKNINSNSVTFKKNQSKDKISNNTELLVDRKNQISLEKCDVSLNKVSNSSKKILKKGKKAKNVKLLCKNVKNIEITVSSGSKKKISLTENSLKPDVLNSSNNESNKQNRKSFLKFAASNPDLQNSNSFDTGNCFNSLLSSFDTGVSVDPFCESNSSPGSSRKVKCGSNETLCSELKNIVVTIPASTPVCKDSVPLSRRSKRIISMKSDSPRKICLKPLNQDVSDVTNITELKKQSSKEDLSLISSKKENSMVHQPIPFKKLQSKRKRLNSIIENLSPVPLESQGCSAQDCLSNVKDVSEVSSMQVEESVANSVATLNNLLDCSIGMTSNLGLSQKQLNYEGYDEVIRLCSSIGLNADKLFQISVIVDSIKNASSEDVFIIRGHKLPSGVIVPSVCITDDLREVLTNYEISKIL